MFKVKKIFTTEKNGGWDWKTCPIRGWILVTG
jgi:hypothetical protein